MRSRYKAAFVLGLFLVAGPTAFAQDGQAPEQESAPVPVKPAPKNTIAVDLRPHMLVIGAVVNLVDERAIVFGVAPWYHRALTENLSLGGRFGYGMFRSGPSEMHSFSADASVRLYASENDFSIMFAEGTVGYANIFSRFFGEDRYRESLAHLFKFGGNVGWRFKFGRDGGFVLETALGYSAGFGSHLKSWDDDEAYGLGSLANYTDNMIARMLFVNGFQVGLSLGYAF